MSDMKVLPLFATPFGSTLLSVDTDKIRGNQFLRTIHWFLTNSISNTKKLGNSSRARTGQCGAQSFELDVFCSLLQPD